MILGVIFGRKRYPMLKYLFVLLIVIGVAMFMYKDKAAAAAKPDIKSKVVEAFDIFNYIGIGELLLLLSLTCDGLTGAVQVRNCWFHLNLKIF
jgi:UDP-galactose transporter B1